MTSSSASLQKYKDRKPTGGVSDLPPVQRQIIELVLAPREIAYQTLCERMAALPTPPTQAQIDNALYELVRVGYLSSFFEDGDVVYMLQGVTPSQITKRDEEQIRSNRNLFRKSDL